MADVKVNWYPGKKKVTVVYKGDNVTVGTGNKTIGTNPDTRVVLDQFYKINKETLGEFLRLEYTGFQNETVK